MLFMAIYTYEPGQRNEVVKKRLQGPAIPEGIKLIGEWVAISGGRSFRILEVPEAKLGLAASLPWTDLGKLELIPVMDTEEAVKLAAQSQT